MSRESSQPESSRRESSKTALVAAAARAAHLLVDQPPYIFEDTMAAALLGDRASELLAYHELRGDHVILRGARAQIVARSRFTEDVLATAVAGVVRQYAILGAGLDSYVYRVATPGLRVFEVDHPASQEAKLSLAAGLPVLTDVTHVPVDFEHTGLVDGLRGSGFEPAQPSVVSWLGVTMYLTRDAIAATLRAAASFAAGTQLVFDYMLPAERRDADGRYYAREVGSVAARGGEPWLTFLTPEECTDLLVQCGFSQTRQLRPLDALPEGLWRRTDSLRPSGLTMLAHATV